MEEPTYFLGTSLHGFHPNWTRISENVVFPEDTHSVTFQIHTSSIFMAMKGTHDNINAHGRTSMKDSKQ